MLNVDTPLDRPEMRRVTFYTDKNNIFYLELAIDRTEFIKLYEFDANEELDPDAVLAQVSSQSAQTSGATGTDAPAGDHDDLLKSLGM